MNLITCFVLKYYMSMHLLIHYVSLSLWFKAHIKIGYTSIMVTFWNKKLNKRLNSILIEFKLEN